YDAHRGRFSVSRWPMGNANRLSPSERESVDAVLQSYGGLTGRKLSYLTHSEDPWRDARGSLPPTARSNAEITPEALVDYYGALDATGAGEPVDDLNWESWEDGEQQNRRWETRGRNAHSHLSIPEHIRAEDITRCR